MEFAQQVKDVTFQTRFLLLIINYFFFAGIFFLF